MSTEPTYADRTDTRPTTPTIGDDPWASDSADAARDTAEGRIAPMAAPYTFDPYCTRRLRNCTDEHNAAMPSGDGETDD